MADDIYCIIYDIQLNKQYFLKNKSPCLLDFLIYCQTQKTVKTGNILKMLLCEEDNQTW